MAPDDRAPDSAGDSPNAPPPGDSTEPESGGISRRRAVRLLGAGVGGAVVAGGGGVWGYRRSLQASAADQERVRRAEIVVAGGSVGGLTVAARLLRAVPDARITVIEPREEHHYQPGYTLVGAGIYTRGDVLWDQGELMQPGMRWIRDSVLAFEPDRNRVRLEGGDVVAYDALVVALGVVNHVDAVEGLREALETPRVAHIYDLSSGEKYWGLASGFQEGRAVFTYPPGYVKCGGAPQKITWLSEDLWRREGRRDRIEVHFHTSRPTLFPEVPRVDEAVTPLVEARGVRNHYSSVLRAVSPSDRLAIFEEQRENGETREVRQRYDLLHAMPHARTPAPLREGPLTREGIGGQLEVDRETLQHRRYPNIFGVGDCAATGAAKTAATIRKQAPVLVRNLTDFLSDRPPSARYDGASGCPLLTRYGRCMMFEFDFEGRLVNEWLYQSTRETRLWWEFKVHGLKRLYRHVMLNGYV
ncbi:MAG: NAD(P)/FAD-dependent oxidoreductase [Gemmatimonadales bacterium]|nr:MAG: NAD(P)/FAD-dependent oxidoreductase [Gemmatimonadales bacterium]